MSKKKLTSEADLAACVVTHLKEAGYTVYQEVLCETGVIDIYATQGQISWAIETKMSFGFSVLEQACARKRFANYVSIATLFRVYTSFEARTIKNMGLGLLITPRYEVDHVQILLPAQLHRNVKQPVLNDFQKEQSVAGTKGGGHWTPFKQTCNNLENHIRRFKDGILFKDAIKEIQRLELDCEIEFPKMIKEFIPA